MKRYSLLIPVMLCNLSCSNRRNDITPLKLEISRRCMKCISENHPDSVYILLNKDIYDEGYRFNISFYSKKAKELFDKYGYPSEREWYIEYDTTSSPVFKLTKVVIPIHKGYDKENKLGEASLKLGFDYTGEYTPDTVISNFELYTDYK